MPLKRRTMAREEWPRLISREYAWRAVNAPGFDGEIGLIRILRVREPLFVKAGERELKIADDGYSWLQLAPRFHNWWLTIMLDPLGEIVEYYFDVTLKNVLTGDGRSYFIDMFLDVVALPGGGTWLLDEDELDQALAEGCITQPEYDAARATANALMSWTRASLPDIEHLARGLLALV